MQIVQATFPAGEGRIALKLLENMGYQKDDYQLIESSTGDFLIIYLYQKEKDNLLDNLQTRFDFTTGRKRGLSILTPDTVISGDREEASQEGFRHTREALLSYARENSRVNIEYLVLILASSVIISLGLILDNIAVIIGGMVIAPVLGPILAITIGIVLGKTPLIKQGISAEIIAVVLAMLIGFVFGIIIPGVEVTDSLRIRMFPSLADLFIATASGAAAAYTLIKEKESLGLVGVMVAAALLPVMATIGIGFALANREMILGAMLLLGVNYLGLLLANLLIFYFEGLKPQIWYKDKAARLIKKSLIFILIAVFLLGTPLTFFTVYQFYAEKPVEIIKRSIRENLDVRWEYRIESVDIRGDLVEVYLFAERDINEAILDLIKQEVQQELARDLTFVFRVIPVAEIMM